MGNVDIETIRKKNFEEGSKKAIVEEYCRKVASNYTDKLIETYKGLEESRDGRYINSDLMKMVYPFYAKSQENRKEYNMSITNSAAVLTNEAYRRAITDEKTKKCIFIAGPYGAGKSYFTQSLFEGDKDNILEDAIVYEGSITPPAFGEKIQYAIENGVSPSIIVLNPTLELSMRNIKERAKKIGRDVEKKEVVDKFSDLYENLKLVVEQFKDIPFIIYNKKSNITINLDSGSRDIEDLNHGSKETVGLEYDIIKNRLEKEEKANTNDYSEIQSMRV